MFKGNHELRKKIVNQMATIDQSRLWKRTLAVQGRRDEHRAPRESLRNAFVGFRKRAETLADEIARDHKHLTVHKIEHIDTL